MRRWFRSRALRRAFTLIELLIVVAIIAILALIAMVNLLESQVRSRVARVKTDMRSLATALEAYRADSDGYPPPASNGHGARLYRLSTPVAYISNPKQIEPFQDQGLFKYVPYGYHGRNDKVEIFWNNNGLTGNSSGEPRMYWWILRSSGPDNDRNGGAVTSLNTVPSRAGFAKFVYDPTNGTTSSGDIWRSGGEPNGAGVDSWSLLNP